MMEHKYLQGEKKEQACTITLDRPQKYNAVNVAILTGICQMAEEITADFQKGIQAAMQKRPSRWKGK